MSFNPDELREILAIYKAESEEHLQRLNDALLSLEKSPRRGETLEEIFREAHSLKGASRMIGFEAVEQIAHALEDLFGLARKGDIELGRECFDVIFEALDAVEKLTAGWLENPGAPSPSVDELLGRIAAAQSVGGPAGPVPAPQGPAAPAAAPVEAQKDVAAKPVAARTEAGRSDSRKTGTRKPPPSRPPEPADAAREAGATVEAHEPGLRPAEETIRVTTQKLDDLMNQIGEIVVTKIKYDERLADVRDLHSRLLELSRIWAAVRRRRPSVPGEDGEGLIRGITERLAGFQERFEAMAGTFTEDNLRLTLVSGELQESINRVRMMPLAALFNLFPRLLRDIARQEGKEVELVLEGGETQLDKKIIEELKDPLTHLLRNAVDHGIEAPEERVRAGKRAAGRIRLAASQRAASVVIEVQDDGVGVDEERIRSIALRRSFTSEEELVEMSTQQVLALLFRPGFSTKSIITDLSGRGVGLDVVLTNIERLKGTITISSERGAGTLFTIRLPISLATTQALLVGAAGQVFALPLAAVEVIDEIGPSEITSLESREAILVEDRPTALVRLTQVLGLPLREERVDAGARSPVVVLGSMDERVAFLVEELHGEHEIVVKGLGGPLRRVRNVSGATVLGDGRVVLILNVFDLIKSSQKVRGLGPDSRRAEAAEQRRPRILIAEDSVTTRTLEKNILEGSGYDVTVAVDGLDALEKLAAGAFDLVVSDVEMPRMDGFELTRRIRAEERHRELPVILVTSLSSEEHRRAGAEAGADAYITKGAFDQGNLLSTIRQLL